MADADDKCEILKQAAQQAPFHEKRQAVSLCPDKARDKLQAYSEIEVKVVKARGLPSADVSGLSDPYTCIFVDDVRKGKTEYKSQTLNPVWNFSTTLAIKNPASVLMLQVMDYDTCSHHDFLGFVEFRIGDLPLNKLVTGWFILAPAHDLAGTAPTRLAKSSERREEKYGAIYLEVLRHIVSGDDKDEDYAWLLPAPAFHDYPPAGWKRKKLDAQGLIDNIMDFKKVLLGGLIWPLVTGVGFVLTWQSIPITIIVLVGSLGISIRPEYFMTGVLGMFGLVLLMLSDPKLSSAIAAQPGTVPLNDEGFKMVAAKRDTEATLEFVTRVIATMCGEVKDADGLREFCAFATSFQGQPACTFEALKHNLRVAGELPKEKRWVKIAGRASKDMRFIKINSKALPKGCLVETNKGKKGEIEKCENEKDVEAWKYLVTFDHHKTAGVISANHLETRIDLQWVSSPTVLALIPDSLEDSFEEWSTFFAGLTTTLKGVEQPIRDVAGWKDKSKSLGIASGCIFLAVVFIWIQRVFFFVLVSYLFAKNAETWVSFFAEHRARAEAHKHASMSLSDWGFFKEAKEDPTKETNTSLRSQVSAGLQHMLSRRSTSGLMG